MNQAVAATGAAREAGFLAKTLALAAKDLRAETRSRDTLLPMLAFCIAVALLLAFSLPPGDARRAVTTPLGDVPLENVLAGFLWITVLFAGLIGFARTFEVERREGALDALILVPVDRSALFLAKGLANLTYVVVTQVLLVPAFVLLFRVTPGEGASGWATLLLVIALADVGFVAIGTLFAALAAQTTSRELMLPILALPALVPLFIATVELTADLFGGAGLSSLAGRGWFGILIAFDAIFGIVGALVFEYALES